MCWMTWMRCFVLSLWLATSRAPSTTTLHVAVPLPVPGRNCSDHLPPHRQSRRDRVPRDPHRATPWDSHGRGLFRRGREGAACAHGGRGGAHWAEPCARVIPPRRQDHRGGEADRGGGDPSGL